MGSPESGYCGLFHFLDEETEAHRVEPASQGPRILRTFPEICLWQDWGPSAMSLPQALGEQALLTSPCAPWPLMDPNLCLCRSHLSLWGHISLGPLLRRHVGLQSVIRAPLFPVEGSSHRCQEFGPGSPPPRPPEFVRQWQLY